MADYCTEQDMIDRFMEDELIQLTDVNNTGAIDATVLNMVISDASVDINSYLGRYTLPLAIIPNVLVRLCCDIARYYLYDDAMVPQVEKRYEAAIKYLEQVAKGVITLTTDASISQPIEDTVQFTSAGNMFSRGRQEFI